jgi:peptidoglycan/LPS O-acetylase OafA/YrhL
VQRRTDIEGLRAIAVLLVLLFHAGVPGLNGGYVGVDVFFVLSGFLITSLMLNERTESGRISLTGFYSRRIRRILPMSSIVAVVTLAASWVWLEPLRMRGLATDVLASAGFASNFVFAHRGADYLQSALPPSPLQHFWSLAVEEQFYVVWPALTVVACLGVARARDAMLRLRVGLVSIVVAVGSFVTCMSLMNENQVWAFYRPHARAFELAVGALLAAAPTFGGDLVRRIESLFAWGGLAAVVASGFVFDGMTRFPGPWALVPVLGTALVLRGGDTTNWAPDALLRLSPFQWAGSRSYSAYLWHWPILVIGAAAIGRDLTVIEGIVCVVMSLALAELSYRFVENPIRREKSIVGPRAFAMGGAFLLVVAGAGLFVRNNPPSLGTGPAATTPTLTTGTTTTVAGVPVSTLPGETTTTVPGVAPTIINDRTTPQAVRDALYVTRVPSNLTPSVGGALNDMPVIYDNDCHAGFGATTPKDCVYGDATSTTVVGLYGDSHAAQWFPAFEKVAIKNKWKLITYTKRGCPPVDIEVYSKVLGKVYKECDPWRANVMKKMKADGVQVVFVASFDRLLDATTRIPIWQKPWRDGLQGTVDALRGLAITPVLVEDTPFPGQDVPTCLSKNITSVTACNVTVNSAFRADMLQVRDDFDAGGVPVLRTRQWFCAETLCPVVVGNLLVYRDDNHMTMSYSRFVAPLLDAAIKPFVDWYSHTR